MTRLSINHYTVDYGSVSLLIDNRNILELDDSDIRVCASHNTGEIRGGTPLELALTLLNEHRQHRSVVGMAILRGEAILYQSIAVSLNG